MLLKIPTVLAKSFFLQRRPIQMQKMFYFKVEPRPNVTIQCHPQSRHSKYCFFHRRQMDQGVGVQGLGRGRWSWRVVVGVGGVEVGEIGVGGVESRGLRD